MAFLQLASGPVVVGLSSRNELFLNGQCAITNCNSFAIHNKFLLVTTHKYVFVTGESVSSPPSYSL